MRHDRAYLSLQNAVAHADVQPVGHLPAVDQHLLCLHALQIAGAAETIKGDDPF